MAVSATETPAKKLKKRASVADLASTPVSTPDGLTETAKKSRKKKHVEALANDSGAEETPVKVHKEKKTGKDLTDHDNTTGDLELVITRLDDALSKEDKKAKKRRKSEAVLAEETLPVVEVAPVETSPEKKKKRKGEVAAAEVPQDSNQTPTKEKKDKKKKPKHDTTAVVAAPAPEAPMTVDAPAPVPSTSEPTSSKKEKKKKRKSAAPAPMDVDVPALAPEPEASPVVEATPSTIEPPKEKKKKRKAEAGATAPTEIPLPETATTTIDAAAPAKKEKKRKRKEGDDPMDIDTPAKPAKKSKAGAIPDPSSDEALSVKGKEALVYAYTHYKNFASFKFNKANQSWLVRNMWKLDEIPEAYTPLLAHYLGPVQGQLRKSLPNICQDRIDSADEPESIRMRAQACRDALAANEPAVA